MKNNKLKVMLVIALLVVIGGGLYLFNGGDLFQGKLSLKSKKSPSIIIAPEDQPVVEACNSNALVVSLANSAPSGSRTVSVTDDIIIFDINVNETTNIQKIRFHITGDPGDIKTVYTSDLRFDTSVRRGTIANTLPGTAYLTGTDSYVTVDYLFDTPFLLESGSNETRWSLVLNSFDLVNPSTENDYITVQITDMYDRSNNTICTNLPISGNRLAY